MSVRPLGHPDRPEAQPSRPESQPARPKPTSGWLAGWLTLAAMTPEPIPKERAKRGQAVTSPLALSKGKGQGIAVGKNPWAFPKYLALGGQVVAYCLAPPKGKGNGGEG